MQYKVSILVPVYNVEQYLRQCMDSIVGQTLKEIEIICVNDGSKDGSLDILKEYAANDSRIVIIDKENGGYGMAMNIAAGRATGEYIGIVEPDDYVPENMFEALYEKASENDLDFVKADFFRFAKDEKTGEVVHYFRPLADKAEQYNVLLNPSEHPEYLKFAMNTWTGIYKRAFLEKNNIRYNETPGASFQDNGFWFQTFFFGERAMLVDTPFYMNRRDNPNSSVKNPQKVYAINVEYDYIRNILTQYPERWEKFKGVFWCARYNGFKTTLKRISDEFKKEYIEKSASEFKFALENNEIEPSWFNKLLWADFCLLVRSSEAYYAKTRVSDTKAVKSLISATYDNVEFKKKVKKLYSKIKKA